MIRADVITLIKEVIASHGVYDAPAANERDVYCTVRSVGMTERYTAMSHGMAPEYQFKIALAQDYDDERQCRYHGKKYDIIRTYETDDGGIELTVQRSDNNA